MSINPLKTVRINLGLTMQALADISGLGYQTILRIEQGLYREISPRLLLVLRHRGVDTKNLVREYSLWRVQKRMAAADRLVDYQSIPGHPLANWLYISGITEIEFCKDFCVNRAIVHKFLKQSYLCGSVPEEILKALHGAGYSTLALEADFVEYRMQLRKKAVS